MASLLSADLFITISKVGLSIYNQWFREANGADRRYAEFGSDVRMVSQQLEKVGEIFDQADREQQAVEAGRRGSQAASRAALNEWASQSKNIIGDFQKTMNDCEKLLIKNAEYASPGHSVYRTAKWYTIGMQRQCDSLRTKLQFHFTKTTFLLEPLQCELLQSAKDDLRIIKRQNRRILTVGLGIAAIGAPPVPSRLASRYSTQAERESGQRQSSHFFLKDLIDAFLHHFSESTISSVYRTPSEEQFNSLFKARWLLDMINSDPGYRAMGTSMTRALVTSVEDKLEAQYERFDQRDLEVQADSLMTRDDDQFAIWIVEVAELAAPEAEEDVGEEKILEMPLLAKEGDIQRKLVVFRQTNTEFRILRTPHDKPGAYPVINTLYHRCVPWYAVPNQPSAVNSLEICHNNSHRGEFYDMGRPEDIHALQHAFTGYRVLHNSPQVMWSMSRRSHKTMKGPKQEWSGAQIWQWDPLDRCTSMSEPAAIETSEETPSIASAKRRPSTLSGESLLTVKNRAASIVSQGASGGSVVATTRPKVPVLIFFTKRDGKLSFLQIPLDPGVQINLYRCHCFHPQSQCTSVIIEKNLDARNPLKASREKFSARVHTANSMQEWNLFMLSRTTPPGYGTQEKIDDALELRLEFASVEARKRFQIWLIRAVKQRESEQSQIDHISRKMRYDEHRVHRIHDNPTFFSQGGMLSPRASIVQAMAPASETSSMTAPEFFKARIPTFGRVELDAT